MYSKGLQVLKHKKRPRKSETFNQYLSGAEEGGEGGSARPCEV